MANHFFQESLFNMGSMVPITEEVQRAYSLGTEVSEAYVFQETIEPMDVVIEKNRQLLLSLEKEVDHVEVASKEKEQNPPKEEEG